MDLSELVNFWFSYHILFNWFYIITEATRLKSIYSSKLSEYEIVIPKRVDENGELLSHNLEHYYERHSRFKRDVGHEVIHYVITIEGIKHHIEAEPNYNFMAPGLVVEHHGPDTSNISSVKIRDVSSQQCHFAGNVRGEPNSHVVLSACKGLAGLIKVGQREYIIEPAASSPNSDGNHEHVIYKRSISGGSSNCGTNENWPESIKERLEWERQVGNPVKYQPDTKNITKRQCQTAMLAEIMNEPKFDCPPLYMEVMITVDAPVYQSFKEKDLETYIFTVFSMVDYNFMDATLGNPINLKLVRIVTLSQTYPELNVSNCSPQTILKNFCKWQKDFNPRKESHPNHHDLAIFITRFNQRENAIMGLTNMASLCRSDKSAAVVSEEGLLLANIITHQIGHCLGAEHDDGENGGCAPEEPDGTRYHMGPFITSSSAWSKCSRQRVRQFLMANVGVCLRDIPADHDFHFESMLPGQVYSATEQCSLALRMDSLPCKIGDFCKNLFCQVSDFQCVSLGDPPAAGTPCAANMWCLNGECLPRGRHPEGINGGWSEWSDWTKCTRSCGGGVQTSYRNCDNPAPSGGGRACAGNWIRHRMCNVDPCTGVMQSFADLQCKMTNDRIYRNRHWTWSSFISPFQESRCGLVCINEKGMVALRAPIMIDGTPCNPGTRDVCIEGTCRRVGCDWVIDSKAKEDACGICHGDGTGCRIVHGQFNEAKISGLMPFLKLPVGTSMIFIREMNPSTCTLCITNSVNSTYFLRGNQELPGTILIAGSKGVYDRKAELERIFLKDPLKSPITVNVLCTNEENSGIIFQYALPEKDPNYSPTYNWQFLSWDKCTDICGGGTQIARAVCVEEKAGEVEDRYCLEAKRPADIVRPCNNFPCQTKWWVGPWSNCESEDNKSFQVRNVLCMKSKDIDGKRAVVVHDSECSGQARPSVERPCNLEKEIERMESKLFGDRWKRSYTEQFMRPYNPDEECDCEGQERSDTKDNEGHVLGNTLTDDDEDQSFDEEDDFTDLDEQIVAVTAPNAKNEDDSRIKLARLLQKLKMRRRKPKLDNERNLRMRMKGNVISKARMRKTHPKTKSRHTKKKPYQMSTEAFKVTTGILDDKSSTEYENINSTSCYSDENILGGPSTTELSNLSFDQVMTTELLNPYSDKGISSEIINHSVPDRESTTEPSSTVFYRNNFTEMTNIVTFKENISINEMYQPVTEYIHAAELGLYSSPFNPVTSLIETQKYPTTPFLLIDNSTLVSRVMDDSGTMYFQVLQPPYGKTCVTTERPPRVDISDPSYFRLFIAPIIPAQSSLSASDAAVQLLGNLAVIPIGTETKITDVVGPTVLQAIAEACRQATKPPTIELCENE